MASSDFDLDLFVIGGGSGGVRASRIAAGHGARVELAESYRMGGTCVIRGCVPKKLFVYASRFADDFSEATGFGWHVDGVRFDWPSLRSAKDKEIARLEAAYQRTLGNAGVTTIATRAEIVDPHTVRLADGSVRSAKYILVATGGWPSRPGFPGADLALTSNDIFDLPELPKTLIIQGGGYIAVEFACLLHRLGVKVTLIYRGEQILRGFDNEIRTRLATSMAAAGIEILTGTDIASIAATASGRRAVALSSSDVREVDAVLAATGRSPNTAGLGLEEAGVKLNAAGAIVVDEQSRTTVPSIYAVGDVTNRINLTPVAIREGHAFADSVFGKRQWTADHTDVPSAIFSTPEIGTVGLSEEAARKSHASIDIYKTAFRSMRATLSGSEERIFMKLVVDGETDRVLGAHMIGDGAGEAAQFLAIPIKMKATKADFDAVMPVHPTMAEEFVTMRTKAT
jgi:glutathione reductase (NADPH)